MRGLTASITTVRQIDLVLGELADGRMDWRTLKKLPPWRAVVIARIARLAGIIAAAELADLTAEAIKVGPDGVLRAYRKPRAKQAEPVLEQGPAEEPKPEVPRPEPKPVPIPRVPKSDQPEWTKSGMIQKSVR